MQMVLMFQMVAVWYIEDYEHLTRCQRKHFIYYKQGVTRIIFYHHKADFRSTELAGGVFSGPIKVATRIFQFFFMFHPTFLKFAHNM